MKLVFNIATWLLFGFVIFGSLTIIYYQSIDGVYINKPFTIQEDSQHLQTDKKVYHRGDMIFIRLSVCRNRDYKAENTWRLINETVITFPTTGSKLVSMGCLTNKLFPIGIVPEYAVPGAHHLENSVDIILNPIHTIHYTLKTDEFLVE